MPNALVTSPVPITLAGGRPVAPGEQVDADLEHDRPLIASGALLLLPDAADAAPAPSPAPGRDLESLTRAELDAHARDLGVEDPESLPNKPAVLAAIRNADTSPET